MKINFLEIAQIELDEAVEYYNFEAPGISLLRISPLSPTSYCIVPGKRQPRD
jgi:hypothetical protein